MKFFETKKLNFGGDNIESPKGFNLPVIMNIPVEAQEQINEMGEQEVTYLKIKAEKILKRYMDNFSNLRKVADYLSDFFKDKFMETLSYEKISKELNISELSVRIIIGELAGWENYPFVIIASPKNKGHFQLHSKNLEETENWITTQSRSVATREQRVIKTRNATLIKKRSKQKVKNKEIIEQELEQKQK